MAKRSVSKPRARRVPDPPVTPAQRRRAIAQLQKDGGAHLGRGHNRLIGDRPAQTIENCKRIIDWFAHIEEPCHSDELEAAKADILHGVVDALEHAETVVRQIGSAPDPLKPRTEVANG